MFNINAPFSPFKISSGAGLVVESDNIGFDKDISLLLAYSYHMEIGKGTLGIGISGGMLNKTLDPKWEIPVAQGSALHHPEEAEVPGEPEVEAGEVDEAALPVVHRRVDRHRLAGERQRLERVEDGAGC